MADKTIAQIANDRDGVSHFLTVAIAHLSYSRRVIARLIITGVLDETVRSGKISSHRISGIELLDDRTRRDNSDFVFPSHVELVQMAQGLNGMGLTIWLMRGCGLRIAEALAVQKSCFRDEGRTLRIHEQLSQHAVLMPLKARKADEYRDIPVPSYLWSMVKGLPDGYLFPTRGKIHVYTTYLRQF